MSWETLKIISAKPEQYRPGVTGSRTTQKGEICVTHACARRTQPIAAELDDTFAAKHPRIQ